MFASLALAGGCTRSPSYGEEGGAASTAGIVNETGPIWRDGLGDVRSVDWTTERLDTSRLRSIEARTLPRTLVEGPHQYASLPEYYWGANPSLLDRINGAQRAFDCVPPPTFHALTLVAGTAGVGKTFIKGSVVGEEHPPSALCKFDIHELYLSWKERGIVVESPDLQDGRLVLNTLPSVTDKGRPWVREYLDSVDANFYVIDSLDEVHSDDYAWILRQIHEFAASPQRRFVHVVVFSRPFALRDYWQTVSTREQPLDVQLFRLAPPEFLTTGDLRVSSWNYQCWQNKLTWHPRGGERQGMPLDAYLRWADQGFAATGPFSSVASEDDARLRGAVDAMLTQWAAEYPVVGGALRNLAGNSMMRDIVAGNVAAGSPYDERAVMEAYLQAWLARETRTDSRPSVDAPENLELYLKLLEQVAATTLSRGDLDDWGYFPLPDADCVAVQHAGRRHVFSAACVMNHSGLFDVECRGAGVAKCRFEPIWMHRRLVEMHNDRVAGKHRDLGLTAADAVTNR